MGSERQPGKAARVPPWPPKFSTGPGSANRGFASVDPERQRESADEPARGAQPPQPKTAPRPPGGVRKPGTTGRKREPREDEGGSG